MSSYETLIELQTDIKSFEDSVDNHNLDRENLLLSLLKGELNDNSILEIKLLDLKKNSEDLKDMITTLEKNVLDFYIEHDVPGIKEDTNNQKDNIIRLKNKLKVKEDEFDKFFKKYSAIEKNIQIDKKNHTMFYFIFLFWMILLSIFLYICFKIYITNKVPSITFYLFFAASGISIYYIYLNLKKYIDI